jgi:hypothetical protein
MLNSLLNFLKNKPDANSDNVPDGYCPNCWGRQEYGGKFLEVVKNQNVDVNSKDPNVGWVQDYANKHLSSIELKQNKEGYVCQKCKLSYKL